LHGGLQLAVELFRLDAGLALDAQGFLWAAARAVWAAASRCCVSISKTLRARMMLRAMSAARTARTTWMGRPKRATKLSLLITVEGNRKLGGVKSWLNP